MAHIKVLLATDGSDQATNEDDLKHHLLGSVSTKVAQAALCSTLIVKL
jgi:nucleotide-binding universal stress UspA family protein